MVSAGVSWEGKTNIVLLTLTDPRSIVKTTFNCWMTIFSQVVGEFILETIMYFTKMGPLHKQEDKPRPIWRRLHRIHQEE